MLKGTVKFGVRVAIGIKRVTGGTTKRVERL